MLPYPAGKKSRINSYTKNKNGKIKTRIKVLMGTSTWIFLETLRILSHDWISISSPLPSILTVQNSLSNHGFLKKIPVDFTGPRGFGLITNFLDT